MLPLRLTDSQYRGLTQNPAVLPFLASWLSSPSFLFCLALSLSCFWWGGCPVILLSLALVCLLTTTGTTTFHRTRRSRLQHFINLADDANFKRRNMLPWFNPQKIINIEILHLLHLPSFWHIFFWYSYFIFDILSFYVFNLQKECQGKKKANAVFGKSRTDLLRCAAPY